MDTNTPSQGDIIVMDSIPPPQVDAIARFFIHPQADAIVRNFINPPPQVYAIVRGQSEYSQQIREQEDIMYGLWLLGKSPN